MNFQTYCLKINKTSASLKPHKHSLTGYNTKLIVYASDLHFLRVCGTLDQSLSNHFAPEESRHNYLLGPGTMIWEKSLKRVRYLTHQITGLRITPWDGIKAKAKWLKEPASLLPHTTSLYFWHELLTFSIRRKMCSANSRMAPRPPLHLHMYPTAFWAPEQASAGTALRPALFRHSSSDTSLPASKMNIIQVRKRHGMF